MTRAAESPRASVEREVCHRSVPAPHPVITGGRLLCFDCARARFDANDAYRAYWEARPA